MTTTTTTTNEMYSASVLAAREDVARLLDDVKCHPILVRLAWHDAGTYDATVTDAAWPMRGGAQMFSRDQMMGGMGMGGDDDDDDDDESPFAGAFDSGESKGAVANVAEKLGDLKDKAASTAKNAWNKAKGFLSRSSRAEDEDFTDDFTAEELAREEL